MGLITGGGGDSAYKWRVLSVAVYSKAWMPVFSIIVFNMIQGLKLAAKKNFRSAMVFGNDF